MAGQQEARLDAADSYVVMKLLGFFLVLLVATTLFSFFFWIKALELRYGKTLEPFTMVNGDLANMMDMAPTMC